MPSDARVHYATIDPGGIAPNVVQSRAVVRYIVRARELPELNGLGARVHFTGLVEHHAVPGHVAGFDIALQPQVVAYASPLKIFDYMAAGRAIVAPDQPNIREILEHGRTALLFDPEAPFDSPTGLWAAIRQLAGDAGLRARLGAAARAELEAKDYTWAGNAQRVAALAHQLRGG